MANLSSPASIERADTIVENLKAAMVALQDITRSLDGALNTMAHKDEPDYISHTVQNIRGTEDIILRSLVQELCAWEGYAAARKK